MDSAPATQAGNRHRAASLCPGRIIGAEELKKTGNLPT